jgi:hypothetical protein
MLAKSEVALLTVSVFGTLTAWLAGPHPSLVTPIYDALQRPHSGASGRSSAKRKHRSNKYRGSPIHFLNFREWYRIRQTFGPTSNMPTSRQQT